MKRNKNLSIEELRREIEERERNSHKAFFNQYEQLNEELENLVK